MQKSIIRDILYAKREAPFLVLPDEEQNNGLDKWNTLWAKISDKLKDDKDLKSDFLKLDELSNDIMSIEVERAYVDGVKLGMKLAYEAFVE